MEAHGLSIDLTEWPAGIHYVVWGQATNAAGHSLKIPLASSFLGKAYPTPWHALAHAATAAVIVNPADGRISVSVRALGLLASEFLSSEHVPSGKLLNDLVHEGLGLDEDQEAEEAGRHQQEIEGF